MDCYYTLNGAWPAKVETPEAIGAALLRMLDDLEAGGGVFTDWGLWAEPMDNDPDFDPEDPKYAKWLEAEPVTQFRGRMAQLVAANVSRYEGEEDIDDGYTILGRSRTSSFEARSAASLSLTCGSKRTNFAAIDVGNLLSGVNPSMVEYQPFKAALLAVAANWPCPWASFGAFPLMGFSARSIERPGPFPWRPIFGMTWMGYLSKERARGLVVPHELVTERRPDGSLLLIAAEEPLDADNPRHVKAAALLGDILAERGGNPSR
jgi:hypothetical protein